MWWWLKFPYNILIKPIYTLLLKKYLKKWFPKVFGESDPTPIVSDPPKDCIGELLEQFASRRHRRTILRHAINRKDNICLRVQLVLEGLRLERNARTLAKAITKLNNRVEFSQIVKETYQPACAGVMNIVRTFCRCCTLFVPDDYATLKRVSEERLRTICTVSWNLLESGVLKLTQIDPTAMSADMDQLKRVIQGVDLISDTYTKILKHSTSDWPDFLPQAVGTSVERLPKIIKARYLAQDFCPAAKNGINLDKRIVEFSKATILALEKMRDHSPSDYKSKLESFCGRPRAESNTLLDLWCRLERVDEPYSYEFIGDLLKISFPIMLNTEMLSTARSIAISLYTLLSQVAKDCRKNHQECLCQVHVQAPLSGWLQENKTYLCQHVDTHRWLCDILATIEEITKGGNKRSYRYPSRHQMDSPAQVSGLGNFAIPVTVKNLGKGGALIEHDADIKESQVKQAELHVPIDSHNLRIPLVSLTNYGTPSGCSPGDRNMSGIQFKLELDDATMRIVGSKYPKKV